MKVLISPVDLNEAKIAWECGTDIIDIKNIREGSLGASFPWVIREVIDTIADPNTVFSATLGDLPYKPGTASLAALGAVSCGVRYVKAGLQGPKTFEEGLDVMRAVVRTCKDYDPDVLVVTAGYADHARFGGLEPLTLVEIAAQSGSDLVMMDTLIKDGHTLFDAQDEDSLAQFVSAAHERNLKVALAGSVKAEHMEPLARMGTDIVGVRGAVCPAADRSTHIDAQLAKQFVTTARGLKPTSVAGVAA